MNTYTFQYGDYRYEYYKIYQERKTVSLTVQPSLNIILRCPHGYPEEKILKFLKRKWHWLEKQMRELKRFQRKKQTKEYVSGESFLYLGRQYKLIVEESKTTKVGLEKGRIVLQTNQSKKNFAQNRKLLTQWYEQRAYEVFWERYRQMLKKFMYNFTPELALRKMEKRWGSFLSRKKILLNPELIKASKDCIDYVIVHELCHMKYKNHSTAYYQFLQSKMPDWKKRKEQLELRFL